MAIYVLATLASNLQQQQQASTEAILHRGPHRLSPYRSPIYSTRTLQATFTVRTSLRFTVTVTAPVEGALKPESLESFIVLIARLTRHSFSRLSQFNRRFLGTQTVISGA